MKYFVQIIIKLLQKRKYFVKMVVLYVKIASKITSMISNALAVKLKICLSVNNAMKNLQLFCHLKVLTISKTYFVFNALTICCKQN